MPNPHLLIGPHLRLEAILSSRIEGTKTNVEDLLRFQAGAETTTEKQDAQEVVNYITAMEYGIQRTQEGFPISIRLFREVHKCLLQDVRGNFQNPGELRKSPVWIGGNNLNDAIFVPPPTPEMLTYLDDLERFFHEKSLPLLIQLAMGHYQFEAIHLFLDGTGRVGRLLIPFMLVDRQVLYRKLSTRRHTTSFL